MHLALGVAPLHKRGDFRNIRRLIADPNVDIVHIATPPHWHGIMAVEAAKAGKDISVLVEKLYNQMMNYRNQMTSIDASLAFAEEYLRMKNAAFLEGMSSSTDLIDAELNLAGVRTERLQAAYNFDLLLAQLLEAAGISDEFSAYARRADARPILFDKK